MARSSEGAVMDGLVCLMWPLRASSNSVQHGSGSEEQSEWIRARTIEHDSRARARVVIDRRK